MRCESEKKNSADTDVFVIRSVGNVILVVVIPKRPTKAKLNNEQF